MKEKEQEKKSFTRYIMDHLHRYKEFWFFLAGLVIGYIMGAL